MDWTTNPPVQIGVYWVADRERKLLNIASVFRVGDGDLLVRYLWGDPALADEMDEAMANYPYWMKIESPGYPVIEKQ